MLTETDKAEIRSEYRGAKDPEKQIAISAQLHSCTTEEVKAALEDADRKTPGVAETSEVLRFPKGNQGEAAEAKLPASSPRGLTAYSEEFKAQVVAAVKAGGKVKKVAEENGITDITVNRWIRQANAREKRAAVEEAQPSRSTLALSKETVSAIKWLLDSEADFYLARLKAELVEGEVVMPETLKNLRDVLRAGDEFCSVYPCSAYSTKKEDNQ